jgi:hypothetical protein
VDLKRIPAGVLDSGMAALATFVMGLYAVRVLDATSLGAYALVFSAFATLMEVPARLILLPAEIDAAKRPREERLGVLASSLRQGTVVAVPASGFVAVAALTIPAEVAGSVVAPLIITAMAATAISPLQDHIRKMLHIGRRSWGAALVSGIQLATMIAVLAIATVAGVPEGWRPFGALAIANVASSCAGLVVWFLARPSRVSDPVPVAILVRSGRWLLVGGVAPGVGGFGAASLVANLLSAQALGYAEAARILARPVAMLSQGVKAVLGPSLVRAGSRRDPGAGDRLSREYVTIVGGLGVLYLLVAGWPWPWNPFHLLMPHAYVIPGLAAATIAVYIADRVAGAGAGLQLLGAGRERSLALGETVASIGRVMGGATAPVTSSFAVPLGYLVMSIIRKSWVRYLLRRLYAQASKRDMPDV